MKVKALKLGYLGMLRRRPGDVFECEERQFSKKWMVEVGSDGKPLPEKDAKPKKADKSEAAEEPAKDSKPSGKGGKGGKGGKKSSGDKDVI